MTKRKIIYEEGCFDEMSDLTQDELNDLISEIERAVDSGDFFENAISLDELPEEEQAEIYNRINNNKRTRQ